MHAPNALKHWARIAAQSFLGHAPVWYKWALLLALALNPLVLVTLGPLITGWLILAEFIFALAMSLKCFPLQSGGLLALETVVLGLTDATGAYRELEHGLPVLLLVIFMVAAVHFLRPMLFRIVGHLLLGIRSRILLNLLTITVVALLSAFLDALTILAVLVAVSTGFYEAYHRVVSRVGYDESPASHHRSVEELHRGDFQEFRAMLRGMLMHGAIGTTIGGVCTLVGEPANVAIGSAAQWTFMEFLAQVSPVTIPTLLAGLLTCLVLERFRLFGYGTALPHGVRSILAEEAARARLGRTPHDRLMLAVQVVVAVLMVLALAFHLAEIGLIGLAVIVVITSLGGITEEHRIAEAFTPGLPFASLLVVFYVIVAMIGSLNLFGPIIAWALSLNERMQVFSIFVTNGLLSAVSDNVFVAAIYMKELRAALDQGVITRALFDAQATAVVVGTGIPSMATPNGQAAFLYLLTSGIAPLVRLGYGRMLWMALPYAVVTTVVAGGTILLLS